MRVCPKSIVFQRHNRDRYGNVVTTDVDNVLAQRCLVADYLDGRYEYSLENLWVTLVVEKIGGPGHFTQLECRMRMPSLNLEFKRTFGITIHDVQGTSPILLPFNNSLGLGKVDPRDAELIVEIVNCGEVLLSRTVPVIWGSEVLV